MKDNAQASTNSPAPKNSRADATAELNRTFAFVEAVGVRVTLALVLVVFALYLTGWVPAFIPPERLIGLVGDGVAAFVQEQHAPTGWQWLGMLQFSDMASLGTLMGMVGVIFAAYLLVIPSLIRNGDTLYLALVLTQLGLFVLAGWGGLGGH